MAKYENGDICTFYFVIREDKIKDIKIVQGWTDDKKLAEFYMEFHKCKNFKLKTVTNKIEEINKILNENYNDEIKICNIMVRNTDPKRKKGEEAKMIIIPATETEVTFINAETNTFMASRVNYSFMNEAIPYLKKKYRDALKSIFLVDIINHELHSKDSAVLQEFNFDQLSILFRSFPENFGV